VGVGSVQRLSAVRWGVAGKVVWAWIFTIPMSAIVAATAFFIINFIHPAELPTEKQATANVAQIVSPKNTAAILEMPTASRSR
jgi:hypothetical protein